MADGNGNLEGLSFASRDLSALESIVDDYITQYMPEITDTSKANPGRRFIRLIMAIADMLHFSLDVALIESLWGVSQQKRNLIEQAKGVGWYYPGVSASAVALKFTTSIPMPSGSGGLTVPRFLVCQTSDTPAVQFVTTETGFIPELSQDVSVTAIEGTRVLQQELTNSASGDYNQRYIIPANRVPFETVQVFVDGEEWEQQPRHLLASELTDKHFVCRILETDLLKTTILFGNDEFGKAPPEGSRIVVNYIRSSGPGGNVAAKTINKIVGPFSTPFEGDPSVLGTVTVSVVNDEGSAGGSDGPNVNDIRGRAPFEQQTRDVYVTEEDLRAGAESVAGVHTASVVDVLGSTATIIVMPEGGGIAPQSLLDAVQTKVQNGALIGAVIDTETIQLAEIILTVDVQLLRTDLSRQEVREDIIDAIVAETDWRVQEIGRGFRLSDINSVIQNIGDENVVDFSVIRRLSRIPRVEYQLGSEPEMQGNVIVGTSAFYGDYQIQADADDPTNKQYVVLLAGQRVRHSNGNDFGVVGVEFISEDGAIRFTLGVASDIFTGGLVYFSTSKYLGNLQLGREEIMAVSNLNQLEVNIYYPGELNAFS